MTQAQLIQGSLEEFLTHTELQGRNDLLLIVPARDEAALPHDNQEQSLAKLFAGRVGRVSFDPPDVAARSEEYFGEIMAQKHGKQAEPEE